MLTVKVASEEYSGQDSAWFGVIPMRAFLYECRAYPLCAENPPVLEGGLYSTDHRGVLGHVVVGLYIKQFDIRGRLLVRTTLATDGAREPDRQLQHIVTARFLTDYATLDTFCRDFGRLFHDGDGEAVLHGT
jgi:hypothetical protein